MWCKIEISVYVLAVLTVLFVLFDNYNEFFPSNSTPILEKVQPNKVELPKDIQPLEPDSLNPPTLDEILAPLLEEDKKH